MPGGDVDQPCRVGAPGKRLRGDDVFALAANYCFDHGIAYEEWLGWGSLSRAVALAVLEDRAKRCPACGEYHEDWEDADGNELRHPPKHLAEFMCFACRAKGDFEDAQRTKREKQGTKAPHGVSTVFVPNAPASPKR